MKEQGLWSGPEFNALLKDPQGSDYSLKSQLAEGLFIVSLTLWPLTFMRWGDMIEDDLKELLTNQTPLAFWI